MGSAAAQQSAAEYLQHGQTPFFRLPSRRDQPPRAVLLGVPYDGGATYQPGARLAPFHVRRVSAFVQTQHPTHEIDVFAALHAIDGGNVLFPPLHREGARAAIEAAIDEVVAAGAAPFVVGGDHSILLPILRAVAARHGPVAVVHFDAHADTSDGAIWGDEFHHGTPLRHALTEGLIAEGQLHQIGLRATAGSADELAYATSRGAHVHPIDEIETRGTAVVAAEVLRRIGSLPTWITFDVDAIDPAFAPGTGTPVPGGLTSREAMALLRGLAGLRLVGMDLVEVCPALDHADLTSHLAAHLLFEGLALAALSRSG
jgi:agmatinase